MEKEKLVKKLVNYEMDGYLLGLHRLFTMHKSHIYKGSFNDIKKGMCNTAPNSILRNNLGSGICKTCIKNTLKEINKL